MHVFLHYDNNCIIPIRGNLMKKLHFIFLKLFLKQEFISICRGEKFSECNGSDEMDAALTDLGIICRIERRNNLTRDAVLANNSLV